MKWTTTTALILTASAGAIWVNSLLTPEREGPRELLERLAAEGHEGTAEQREALRRLTIALESRDIAADPELTMALYRARGTVYRSLGLLGSAREDLQHILTNWAREDSELELEVADLMALEGQTEAALERVVKIVEGLQPDDAYAQRAFELLGRVQAALAERRRGLALAGTRLLDDESERRATEIIVEASARGKGDLRTAELLTELRTIFRAHEAAPITDVLALVLEAGEASQAALQAFARSMQLGPTPLAVTEVAEMLATVDHEEHATDLMLAARAVTSIERSPAAVGLTIRLLDQTGRMGRAHFIGGTWDWRWGADLEFYRSGAERLFRAGVQGGVARFADGMARSGPIGSHWAGFYFNASVVRGLEAALQVDPNFEIPTDEVQLMIDSLRRYAYAGASEQPYPGTLPDTWFLIASGARMLGNADEERTALLTGLRARPSSGSKYWVRVAELEAQMSEPAWAQIESRYTVALGQEPARTSELLERWTAAGDRALASDRLELPALIDEARISPDGRPLRTLLGASVVWRIAEAHLHDKSIQRARLVATELLKAHPRLVPAMDTLIEAQLSSFDKPSVIAEAILRRIELAGADARTDAFLARLPEPLSGKSLAQALRAAPERFGRPTAARLALEEGDVQRAADLLDPLDASTLSPTLRLFRGRVRLDAGRLAAAREDFDVLLADPEEAPRALLVAIELSLLSGNRTETDSLVQRASESLPSKARLEVVDALLSHGRLDLAQNLLGELDQSVESRTAEFYGSLVRYATLTRDTSTIDEAIARAEPYSRDGSPEIAELILSIRDRNWLALPDVVDRLRNTGIALTPYEDTCLSLLAERLEPGRRLAERFTAAQPRSAEWALLRTIALALEGESLELPAWFGARASAEATEVLLGNRRARRDPRELLAVLLLLERKEWRPWVAQELQLLREQSAGRLWPIWLEVMLHARSGADEAARARVDELLAEFADFGPAWDRRLASVTAAHVSDPLAVPLLQTRVARLGALGDKAIEDPVELALARASAEALAGAYDKAMYELGRTLTRERRADFDSRFTLGALLVRAGQDGLAVDHLREAATNAPPESAAAIATALVEAMLRAASPTFAQRAPIPPSELPARLESVKALFPTDPIVSCHWIRHGSDSSQRATRAHLELARLRRESGKKSLETMRRGSTRAWVDLTLEVAPELARELVDLELELRPGDVDLWELAAKIAKQFGDNSQAEALFRTVLAMEKRPSACLALAELRMRRGATLAEVQDLLKTAAEHTDQGNSTRALLIVTEFMKRDPFPDFRAITAALEAHWKQRGPSDGTVTESQLGFALVTSYLQWAGDLERQRAAFLAHPPPAGVPTPTLPTESELAEKALATLIDLEAAASDHPHLSALLESYRGIAVSILKVQSTP